VAEVVVDNDITSVHALSIGTATLTVSRGGLTANATLTVLATSGDGTLPDGTTLWELAPSPQGDFFGTSVPFQRGEVLRAVPTDTVNGPQAELFFIEHSLYERISKSRSEWQLARQSMAHASFARATLGWAKKLWTYTPPTPARQVAVDNWGGVILNLGRFGEHRYDSSREHAIQRVDGRGVVVWELRSSGTKREPRSAKSPSIPNGTLFFVENTAFTDFAKARCEGGARRANGQTGVSVGRWTLQNTASDH